LIVADSSFLYALLDARDRRHAEARTWYETTSETFVTTPLVLAEVDYFAMRAGPEASRAFYADVRAGAYAVEWWPSAGATAAAIADQYASLGLGLVDASLVALAERAATESIATFDERHFRAVRPRTRAAAFTLFPLDANP
jgi:predicted nucleic acid-binding protein